MTHHSASASERTSRSSSLAEAGPPERLAFDLVPDAEADFPRGYLGVGTPLARAILGRTAGEVLSYRAAEAFDPPASPTLYPPASPYPIVEKREDQIVEKREDQIEVRILSVAPAASAPPTDTEARRQTVIREAVARSEALNDAAFALAAGSKWGDYDPAAIPPDRPDPQDTQDRPDPKNRPAPAPKRA